MLCMLCLNDTQVQRMPVALGSQQSCELHAAAASVVLVTRDLLVPLLTLSFAFA